MSTIDNIVWYAEVGYLKSSKDREPVHVTRLRPDDHGGPHFDFAFWAKTWCEDLLDDLADSSISSTCVTAIVVQGRWTPRPGYGLISGGPLSEFTADIPGFHYRLKPVPAGYQWAWIGIDGLPDTVKATP